MVASALAVCLLSLSIVLAVEAGRRNGRIDSVLAQGVPVSVTVTDCLALASGTGITEVGFTCRGSFTLNKVLYNEVIDGTAARQPVGSSVAAVAVPDDPAILYTARAAAGLRASWTAFVAPGTLVLLAVALGSLPVLAAARRHPRP